MLFPQVTREQIISFVTHYNTDFTWVFLIFRIS